MILDLSGWARFVGLLAAEAILLVAAGAIASRLARGAQLRRAVWQAVLVAVALAWIGEFAGVREKIRSLALNAAEADGLSPASQTGASGRHGYLKWLVQLSSRETAASPSVGGVAGRKPVTWPVWVWLAGTAGFLLRAATARGWLAVQRRRMSDAGPDVLAAASRLRGRLGLRRLQLRVWPELRGPVAFGTLRPTVALPGDFEARYSASEREAMLAHELAHLAAHDPFWLALGEIVRACAWWHPAVWRACRELRASSEAAADEASALVPEGRSALAGALARLGREWVAPGAARGLGTTGSGFRSELGRRVSTLLGASDSWNKLRVTARWAPRVGAVALVTLFTLVPVRTGLSGVAFLAAVGQGRPGGNQPVPAAPAPAGRGTVSTNNAPAVVLACRFVTLSDGQPEEIGLDWLFGQSPTNGSDIQNGFPTNFFERAHVSPAENFRMDYWRTENQSFVLSDVQFHSLLHRIEQREDTDILSAPTVKTLSGRQAHLTVGDAVTVVTGIETVNAAPTNHFEAKINYTTHPFLFGIEMDLLPSIESSKLPEPSKWHVTALAALNAFLGYDKPGTGQEVAALSKEPGKPIRGVKPLPHFFTAEAQTTASLRMGETLVLRGPRYPVSDKDKEEVLSRASLSVKKKARFERLYVFVTLKEGDTVKP